MKWPPRDIFPLSQDCLYCQSSPTSAISPHIGLGGLAADLLHVIPVSLSSPLTRIMETAGVSRNRSESLLAGGCLLAGLLGLGRDLGRVAVRDAER